MIQFHCSCGETLTTSDQNAGKTVSCTRCGEWVAVPGEVVDSAPARLWSSRADSEITRSPDRSRRPVSQNYSAGSPAYQPATSGRAVTSLILGLISFCLPVLLSIPAIILGFLGLADVKRGKAGRGLALTGLIIGFLTLVEGALLTIGGILFAMIVMPYAQAHVDTNLNLKQIGLAMHGHHDVYKKFPQHAIYSKDGKQPLLSWRVKLLPFLEQSSLYHEFNLDEPWDSPHNKKLLTKMPKVYAHRLDPKGAAEGLTYYQVFVGEPNSAAGHPIFIKDGKRLVSLAQITASDGAANTILLVEAGKGVPWTAPEDIPFSHTAPLPKLGLAGGQFQAVFAHGEVVSFNQNGMDEKSFRFAITHDDGQVFILKK